MPSYSSTVLADSPVLYYRLKDATVNLFTANDASFEGGIGNWIGSGCTVAQSAAQARYGTHSMLVTALATGSLDAVSSAPASMYIPVVPGQSYTALASVLYGSGTARATNLIIDWYKSDKTTLISTSSGATVTPTSSWQNVPAVTATAPALAAFVRVLVNGAAGAISDTLYVDGVLFGLGTVTAYSDPTTTVADSSTSANTGTIHGGVCKVSPGAVIDGGATLFDGGTGYVQSNSVLPAFAGSITLEAWANFSANPSTTRDLLCLAGNHAVLQVTSAGLPVVSMNLNGATQTVTGSALSLNAWHHIVGTWNGTTLALYVDGASAATATPAGPLSVSSAAAFVGASITPSAFFPGDLAEVAVYNTALSGTRITAHYNAGLPPSETISAPSDTIARGTAQTRAPSDSITAPSETITRHTAQTRTVSDALPAPSEVAWRSQHLTISESLTITDTYTEYLDIQPLPAAQVRPYFARIYSNGMQFKQTVGNLLNRPVIKSTLNAGFHPVTVQLPGAASQSNVSAGDIIQLYDQDLQRVVFSGFVADDPVDIGSTAGEGSYTFEVDPMVTELGDTPVSTSSPYTRVYSVATDVGQMVRDLVDQCPHLNWTPTSVPLTGVKQIYTFDRTYTCLQALQDCVKLAGAFYYYFCDENGTVWFLQANLSAPPTWTIRQGADYEAWKYTAPIQNTKSWVHLVGGTPLGSAVPIEAVYDGSAGTAWGRRALMPPLEFPNVLDSGALYSMAKTIGQQMNRRFKSITFKLPAYADVFSLSEAGGPTLQYFEPASIAFNDSFQGAGGMSPTLVIVDVERDGLVQTIIAADMPVTIDDLSQTLTSTTQQAVAAANSTPYSDSGLANPSLGGGGGCGGFSVIADNSSAFSQGGTGADTVSTINFTLDSSGNAQMIIMASVSLSSGTGSGLTAKLTGLPAGALSQPQQISVGNGTTLLAVSLGGCADGTYNVGVEIVGAGGTLAGQVDIAAFVYCNCTAASVDTSSSSNDSSALGNGTSLGNTSADKQFQVVTPQPDMPAMPSSPNWGIPLSGNENSASWDWVVLPAGVGKVFTAAPGGKYVWPRPRKPGEISDQTPIGVTFRTEGAIEIACNLDFTKISSATTLGVDIDIVAAPVVSAGYPDYSQLITGFSDFGLTTPFVPQHFALGVGVQSGNQGCYIKIPRVGTWVVVSRIQIPVSQLPGWLESMPTLDINSYFDSALSSGGLSDSGVWGQLTKIVQMNDNGYSLPTFIPDAFARSLVQIYFDCTLDVQVATQ